MLHVDKHFIFHNSFQFNDTLKLSKDYIKQLNIKQLLPPVKEPPIKDEDEDDDR